MSAPSPRPPIAPGPSEGDSLGRQLRSIPRPVWVLFAGVFLNKFGTFVLPFLAIYLTRRGFSTADAGVALGAYGLGRIVAAFLGGHLADAMGRRRTVLLSMTCTAVVMVLLSRAETLPAIAILTALASLTGEMYVPACMAWLTDLTAPEQRLTVFSTYRMAFNAGWALGPAVAAFLASHSFTWLFIGDAATSLLFALIAWRWLPVTAPRASREAGWGEAVAVLRGDRRFHRVALATLLVGLCIHQMVSSYGVHVAALGFSDTWYGLLLSANGLIVLACELPLTRVTRRFPGLWMIAAGYACIGVAMAMNVFVHTIPGLFLGVGVFTFGEMLFAPMMSAYISKLAPANMRGRYVGAWAMFNSVAMFLAPNVGLRLQAWNSTVLWFGCGSCALLAAIVIATSPSTEPRDG